MKKQNISLLLAWALLMATVSPMRLFAAESNAAQANNTTETKRGKKQKNTIAARAKKLYDTLKDDWKCLLDRKRKCTWQQKARITAELVALAAILVTYRAYNKALSRELYFAVMGGHTTPNEVRSLIRRGANPNIALDYWKGQNYKKGYTPLYILAKYSTPFDIFRRLGLQGESFPDTVPDIAQALLEGGANPNTQTRRGGTPLHQAAASRRLELVRKLLQAGADPTIANQKGKTPLDMANTEAIKDLIGQEILRRKRELVAVTQKALNVEWPKRVLGKKAEQEVPNLPADIQAKIIAETLGIDTSQEGWIKELSKELSEKNPETWQRIHE